MKLFKKKATPETEYVGLFPDGIIYSEYNMKIGEVILMKVIGFSLGAMAGWAFYGAMPIAIMAGIGVSFAAVPMRRKQAIGKQINTLKIQFKDMLESVSTSIGAGRNIVSSFTNAHADLKDHYSEDSFIAKELANIVSGIHNNINIEDLLQDLAKRSGIDDVRTFAEVFETCYRRGGDIKEVIASTHNVINDKMEIDMEIQTMITSAKTELNIMCAMPIVFVLILNSLGGNITGRGTASGTIATTLSLIIFVAAYFVGRKIMTIRM